MSRTGTHGTKWTKLGAARCLVLKRGVTGAVTWHLGGGTGGEELGGGARGGRRAAAGACGAGA
eukprot:904072-Rhodomonas_salina.1